MPAVKYWPVNQPPGECLSAGGSCIGVERAFDPMPGISPRYSGPKVPRPRRPANKSDIPISARTGTPANLLLDPDFYGLPISVKPSAPLTQPIPPGGAVLYKREILPASTPPGTAKKMELSKVLVPVIIGGVVFIAALSARSMMRG